MDGNKKLIAVTVTTEVKEAAEALSRKEGFEMKTVPPDTEAVNIAAKLSFADGLIIGSGYEQLKTLLYVASFIRPKPFIFILGSSESKLPDTSENGKTIIIKDQSKPEYIAQLIRLHMTCLPENIGLTDKSLESRVTERLLEGGVMPGNAGFQYLRDAICRYIRNDCQPCCIGKSIYDEIAPEGISSSGMIGRGIRDTIKKIWENSTEDYRRSYFGTSAVTMNRRPKPKEFIATFAYRISREL